MNEQEKINYVEFPSKDIPATKAFFTQAFGWTFEDYGPEYTAFSAFLSLSVITKAPDS